jgi:hypothetical protein
MVTILFQKYDIVCGIPKKKTSKKKEKKKANELSERAKDSLWFGKKGENFKKYTLAIYTYP